MTSSKASRSSTSRRSPASRRRSSASRAATGRRSPAARGCSPTGSSCRSRTAPGESFIDRMIALVEGADRQKTPNEIALNILLVGAHDRLRARGRDAPAVRRVLDAPGSRSSCSSRSLVCLIPTTIGALLSAIGIAGMDRLVQRNVLAMSGGRSRRRATCRRCCSTRPARSPTATAWPPSSSRSAGVDERTLAEVVLLSSLADETPEGRSIVDARGDAVRPWRRSTCRMPSSCPSPRRPACRASNGRDGRSARARPTRSSAGWRSKAGRFPRPDARWSNASPAAAAPRSSSPRATGARRDPPQGHGEAGHRAKFAEMRALGIRT